MAWPLGKLRVAWKFPALSPSLYLSFPSPPRLTIFSFLSIEDEELLLSNSWEELEGSELELSCHRESSPHLERLLHESSLPQVAKFIQRFPIAKYASLSFYTTYFCLIKFFNIGSW